MIVSLNDGSPEIQSINTVKTKAMYLSVIGLGYHFFVLDRLPLAQSLSRMLTRKRFKITRLAVS
jgi:hypothetical protein